MPRNLTEHPLESRPAWSGRFLQVRCDRVRLPDGGESTREYVVHPGAAAMVPIFPDERILIERQYRYPVRATFTEIPAGKIDAGETALETARRELREETGYSAREWAYLTRLHPAIGFATEVMDVFLCRDL
ncbi:MAG: NUDIX domain-containing protein, partial [Gammaproteobacteria bacterium]